MSSKCNFSVLSTKMSICLISIWSSRVCFENYFSKSTTEKFWKLAFLQLSITIIVFQFTSFFFSAFICFFFFSNVFFLFIFYWNFFIESGKKIFKKVYKTITNFLKIFWLRCNQLLFWNVLWDVRFCDICNQILLLSTFSIIID